MKSLHSSNWGARLRAIEREREMTSLLEGIDLDDVGFTISLWSEEYIWVTFSTLEKMTQNLAGKIRKELSSVFGKLKWKRTNRTETCDWQVVIRDYWEDYPKTVWLEISGAPIAKNCHVEEYEETKKRFKVVCD